MNGGAIYADAQYLGIRLLEPAVLHTEPGDLVRSPSGERHDVERQNHVLLPTVLAQTYVFARMGAERKVWGLVANLYRHV